MVGVAKSQFDSNWDDRDDFEDEATSETEDDVSVSPDEFSRLSIAPSDWTVGTIYNLIGKQISLDPAYQRRSVWAEHAKSQFIESLMLGIPIPQILLAAPTGHKNSFLVLDGKQRLTTIREFLDGSYSDGKPFRLKGLHTLHELNNHSWADLSDTEWAGRLENEPIRTTVLRGWTNENILYEIFYRLNSGSVRLSPMELRMSLHPGEFLRFIMKWTEQIGPIHRLLRKRIPDPRMGDVELAVRFLAFADRRQRYRGDLKRYLDEYCKQANADFANSEGEQVVSRNLIEMNAAINAGFEIFGDHFCRKYNAGGYYEHRFNRAVFDVLVGSLSHPQVRKWAEANQPRFKALFETVCSVDPWFARSIETTTKSLDATGSRFEIWYRAVEHASSLRLEMPNI
jgi:hypothetical protein